jgi:hypothetical protein
MTLHAPPLLEELCIFACHVCVSIRIRCSSTRTTRDRSHTMNDARGAFTRKWPISLRKSPQSSGICVESIFDRTNVEISTVWTKLGDRCGSRSDCGNRPVSR